MNKQPFYHRAVVLFTATEEISLRELEELLFKKMKGYGIISDSIVVEELEIDPGDPADLC